MPCRAAGSTGVGGSGRAASACRRRRPDRKTDPGTTDRAAPRCGIGNTSVFVCFALLPALAGLAGQPPPPPPFCSRKVIFPLETERRSGGLPQVKIYRRRTPPTPPENNFSMKVDTAGRYANIHQPGCCRRYQQAEYLRTQISHDTARTHTQGWLVVAAKGCPARGGGGALTNDYSAHYHVKTFI